MPTPTIHARPEWRNTQFSGEVASIVEPTALVHTVLVFGDHIRNTIVSSPDTSARHTHTIASRVSDGRTRTQGGIYSNTSPHKRRRRQKTSIEETWGDMTTMHAHRIVKLLNTTYRKTGISSLDHTRRPKNMMVDFVITTPAHDSITTTAAQTEPMQRPSTLSPKMVIGDDQTQHDADLWPTVARVDGSKEEGRTLQPNKNSAYI